MKLAEGKVLVDVSLDEFKKFISERKITERMVRPNEMKIIDDGMRLRLDVFNSDLTGIEIRRSFLYKLLNWHKFPLYQLRYLTPETVAGICNDYLLSISSPQVKLVVEDDQALTIKSMKYSEFPDTDILKELNGIKIDKISRDDFVTRIYSEVQYKANPVPGDEVGFGFNILNSETGFMPLSYRNYMLRYVCTNGLIIKEEKDEKERIYHYNNKRDVFTGYLMKQIGKTKTLNDKMVLMIRKSAESRIGKKLMNLQKKLDIMTNYDKKINLMEMLNEDNSVYEAANMITSGAKNYDPYHRLKLEEFAGSLMFEKINLN